MKSALPDVVNRIVAFVDILGFRNLVDQAFEGDQALLARLNQILESVVNFTSVTRDGALGTRELSPHLQATAFSDTIVISDCFNGFGFHSVVATAALLASDLLGVGILTRGAFAVGPTIHKDRILFGKGVVAAYQLEREVAVFPQGPPVRGIPPSYLRRCSCLSGSESDLRSRKTRFRWCMVSRCVLAVQRGASSSYRRVTR